MHLLRPEILIALLRLNIDLIFVALVSNKLRTSLDEVIATNYWTVRASMRREVSELVASPSTSSLRWSHRHPSISVARSRTPKTFMPSGETAYSSWIKPMWRNPRVSTKAFTIS
jgi:hypothetical protein